MTRREDSQILRPVMSEPDSDACDRIETYHYELPAELIAKVPLAQRDASRLLVVHRDSGQIEHRRFRDLPQFLSPGDCIVFNDSRVIPARLVGTRVATGGKWEGLYLDRREDDLWRLLGQTRGRIRSGERVAVTPTDRGETTRPQLPEPGNSAGQCSQQSKKLVMSRTTEELVLELLDVDAEGIWLARCHNDGEPLDLLQRFGTVPLPPYLKRKQATALDWERYQTEYSRVPGSVAAPTAGLHFTSSVREQLAQRGIQQAFVTLHVGIGTFRPIGSESLSQHAMHAEWCEVGAETVAVLDRVRAGGRRIVAVGTTTVRTLESVARTGPMRPWRGETSLFIRPPYRFQIVDALVTNFHLPRSTLFALVCAFGGIRLMQRSYAAAIAEHYRFYSYGDSVLIV